MTRDDILRMAREAGIDAWWDSGNECREDLQAHLEHFSGLIAAAQPAPSVPNGWKLVPIEPTTEIRKAMHYAYWQSPQLPYHDGSPELWNAVYAAMLKAAAQPAPSVPDFANAKDAARAALEKLK